MKEDTKMMYLIIEETQYNHTDNNYHVEDCTNDYNKAIDMLQGYKLINKREDRTYSILKYESPLLLTKEMEC
jgi:hypothetical protein